MPHNSLHCKDTALEASIEVVSMNRHDAMGLILTAPLLIIILFKCRTYKQNEQFHSISAKTVVFLRITESLILSAEEEKLRSQLIIECNQ